MTRRSVRSAGLFASVLVVLVSALAACTDPNTMQASSPSQAREIDLPRR